MWDILEHSTQYNNVSKLTRFNISDALLYSCVQWCVEMCSSACIEKLIYAHLESDDTKYGVANYEFKLLCPFEVTDGVVFGIKNIVQVSSFQICIWFCNWTLTFLVILI